MRDAAVPETLDVAGDLGPCRPLVDPHLGHALVVRDARAEHRDPSRREVLDQGRRLGPAQGEDDGVEGKARDEREQALLVIGGLAEQQQTRRDRVELLREPVEDGDGERVPEGDPDPALDDDPDNAGAASTDYLQLFGLTALAYMWGLQAKAALAKIAGGDKDPFYERKLTIGRYYLERILPETHGHLAKLKTGAELMMKLPAEAF